jgi:hypothetical protein
MYYPRIHLEDWENHEKVRIAGLRAGTWTWDSQYEAGMWTTRQRRLIYMTRSACARSQYHTMSRLIYDRKKHFAF